MSYYEVIIELATPLAYQSRRALHPLTLDSLLTFVLSAQDGNFGPPEPEEIGQYELPLVRVGQKYKFYKASALWVDRPAKVGVFNWTRSQNWVDAAYKYTLVSPRGKSPFAENPNPGSGAYRQWRNSLLVVATPRIRFWFDGDGAEVEKILANVTHIGVRRSAGFGRVADLAVRASREDYSLIDPAGYAARPLPVEEITPPQRGPEAYEAYTPPYWYSGNMVLCYIPPSERWLPVGADPEIYEFNRKAETKEETEAP